MYHVYTMNHLPDIAIFVAVVERGSFTSAADDLGISKSYASRRVRALEDHLGSRLMDRTTRRISLTEAGRAYYEQVAPHLEGLASAERAVAALQAEPRGTLRLAAPLSFGLRWLQPAVMDFMERWPELAVEVSFDDRTVDVVAEGFDLAIRGGRLLDSALVARKLAPITGVVVASPAYLAKHGRPEHPDELQHHRCLDYAVKTSMPQWWLEGPDGEHSARIEARLVADNGLALVEAARAGLGICYQPDFLVRDGVLAGELVPLFPGWRTWSGAFHAVYPHRRHLSPKVRLLVEHLVTAFEGPPWCLSPA